MMPIRFDDLDHETVALVESALPEGAREFVRLVGLRATLALIAEFGGIEISFPQSAVGLGGERFDQIAAVVGIDNAENLGRWFKGCEPVYIPRAVRAMAAIRNRQMIEDFEQLTQTKSARRAVNDLAFSYRMCSRAIENIVNCEASINRRSQPTTKEIYP